MSNKTTLQVGVKILLKDNDGKHLLLRRVLEKYPDIEGRWDIVGGRIDPGISLIENLRREVKEETNLDLVEEPKFVFAQDIIRNTGIHVVRLTYTGRAKGELSLDGSEHDMHQWYSIDDLKVHEDIDMYFKELLNKGVFSE